MRNKSACRHALMNPMIAKMKKFDFYPKTPLCEEVNYNSLHYYACKRGTAAKLQ